MAVGARCGARFGSPDLAAWLPMVVLGLAGLGVLTLRIAPAAIGAAPGEAVTTSSALWLWALAIVPAALAGGTAFPTLAGQLGSGGGGRAYGFEALGALTGGVLVAVLAVFFQYTRTGRALRAVADDGSRARTTVSLPGAGARVEARHTPRTYLDSMQRLYAELGVAA